MLVTTSSLRLDAAAPVQHYSLQILQVNSDGLVVFRNVLCFVVPENLEK
jgi:hypothetical protein